jgi:Holliday junction resolvase RusA-like endonuclease
LGLWAPHSSYKNKKTPHTTINKWLTKYEKMPLLVDDLVSAASGAWKTMSFNVSGEAPVQQSLRSVYRNLVAPRHYDPSKREKVEWKKAVTQEMVDCGVPQPFFTEEDGPIKVVITFYFTQRFPGERYPSKKDLDNVLKFVLDAIQGPVYWNDKAIVEIHSRKVFGDTAWVDFKITTSSD